jgi:ketosteroid isomerase-like protein
MSRAAVEAGEKAWLAAFNAGDAAGVAKQYTDAARLMAPNAPIVEGRAAIEGFVKEFVATGAQLTFELLSVHESADMCASVGKYVMDFPADAPQDLGKFIEVWRRQGDGSWLIADDIFNSDLPPAAG